MDGVDSEGSSVVCGNGDRSGEDVCEGEGAEAGEEFVFWSDGLIEGEGLLSSGVGDFDLGGFGAVLMGLPVEADFIVAAFFDAEREGGGGVSGSVLIAAVEVGLEVGAAFPVAFEFCFAVIDDEPSHVFDVSFLGVGAKAALGDGWDGEFAILGRTEGTTGLLHEVDEKGEVVLVDSARGRFLGGGDPGCFTNHFSHHATGAHDAGGAEGASVDRDAAAGHEEVLDILRVHDAVGDTVAILTIDPTAMLRDGDEGVFFGNAF